MLLKANNFHGIFVYLYWWCLPTSAYISLACRSPQLQMIYKQLNQRLYSHWLIQTISRRWCSIFSNQGILGWAQSISCSRCPLSRMLHGSLKKSFQRVKWSVHILQHVQCEFDLERMIWMMERHFPFPYAAPQIYASPGCNAENSNFNMKTQRDF